jgi:uncharacterized protein YjiS (DUF1127 family)
MSFPNVTPKIYSFVKCLRKGHMRDNQKEVTMFTRLATLMQLRRSTAFLLERADDRLLDDIGLSRHELEAMRLGLGRARSHASVTAFPSGRVLPALAQA